MNKTLYFKVIRNRINFDFVDPKGNNPYAKRAKNNFKDTIQIIQRGHKVIFEGRIQSIANHPNAPTDGSWSLQTGTFTVKLFEQQRQFNCAVHGIGNGYDMKGNFIDPTTFDIKKTDKRFLLHDDEKRGPEGIGKVDTAAYSEGCLIQPKLQYFDFNKKLLELGCEPGEEVILSIVEV